MRVLVIGGTGTMGAPTARLLQQRGHEVVVLSRGSACGQGTAGGRPVQPECEHIVCDCTADGELERVLCAPSTPRVVVDFSAMETGHVQSVLNAHARAPLAHYGFISTNMVYPGGE
jgi:nucleoside-diphosphate-sugar epimerase